MNRLVAVAIDKDKGSQSALKWAVENILIKGQTVVLIHVNVVKSSSSSVSSVPYYSNPPSKTFCSLSILAGDMQQEALSSNVPDINIEDPTIGNLKSNQNQLDASVTLEPSLDSFQKKLDAALLQLPDPEEYFLAYERLESIRREGSSGTFGQAKVTVDGGSELLNSNFAPSAEFESKDEAIASKGKQNTRERRPALGRKQARFCFKNQPSVTLEPLDIAKLQDPEEFFLAYERHENAKKEIQRLKGGVVTHSNEYNPSKTARCRRPGLLGKKYTYNHCHYSSALAENNNTSMSSQETLERDILIPSYGLPPETTDPNIESQEKELAGSGDKTENRSDDLLDELLSSNFENLDEQGVISFLQERLQIKPIVLDKLCLPDLHDIKRNAFMGEKLPKPQNTLSDKHNLVKVTSGKTPVKHKQVAESSINLLDSSNPPRSPFASISILKNRILQSNMPSDPFSAVNVDLSPSRNPSSVECIGKQSDQVDLSKEMRVSEKLKSILIEKDNNTVVNMGTPALIRRDSFHLFDTYAKDNSSSRSVGIDVWSSGSHGDLEYNNGSSNIDERLMDDNVSRSDEMDVQRTGPNEMEEHVEDMLHEAVSSPQPVINVKDSTGHVDTDSQIYGPIEMEENVQAGDMQQEALLSAVPDINIEDLTMENLKSSQSQLEQSSLAAVEHYAMNGPSRTPDIAPEQHNEDPPRISSNKQSKATKPPREIRKRKAVSRRQSLAAAGTFWESGVRRSSRIKMRPLEYWKGERFLYGRINESVTSVIGVKYASPVKGNEKRTIKVKSYVPDEYKELVELAALH